jgi:hypothetical protein
MPFSQFLGYGGGDFDGDGARCGWGGFRVRHSREGRG